MSKEEKLNEKYPFQFYTFSNISMLEQNGFNFDDYSFNLQHEHELYIGNINGLICRHDMGYPLRMLKYLKQDPDTIVKRKLTFLLPENYKENIDNLKGLRENVIKVFDLPCFNDQINILTYKVDNSNIMEKIEELKNMPKFDVCIGNPPYSGQGNPLYLNICELCTKISKTVVWLCPTQWTNTLKYVKWYDYYKNNLNCIFYKSVGNPFKGSAVLANEVAIYVFGTGQKIDLNELVYLKFINQALAKSIWEKTQKYLTSHDNIWKYNQINYNKPYYVHNSGIRGNVHESKPCWDWTTLFGEKNHIDFSIATTKFDSTQIMWNFDTINECNNFINCLETDIFMFLLYCVKMNNNNHRGECKYLPWFSDYTHPWTEQDIQKELGLTNDEINYIHDEMKNFGWKVAPKKIT